MKLNNISILINIAKGAGNIILNYYKNNLNVEYKKDKTPVTDADKEANLYIIQELKSYFPSIPIISEEEETNNLHPDDELFWLVDPLDGTKAFINNDPDFTVNIALIKDKIPFLGIIYHPISNEVFYNLDGENSYKIDKKGNLFKMNADSGPKDQTVVIIGTYSSAREKKIHDFLDNQGTDIQLLHRASSIKFCYLAEGKANIYPRFGKTMEWDTAAGHAILNGAGGIVLDLYGNELQYKKDSFLNKGFLAYSNKSIIKKNS